MKTRRTITAAERRRHELAFESLVKKIGVRLRQRRELIGLSQAAVAKRSGISESYVSQLECGRRNPSVDVVFAVATVLDVELEDLVR